MVETKRDTPNKTICFWPRGPNVANGDSEAVAGHVDLGAVLLPPITRPGTIVGRSGYHARSPSPDKFQASDTLGRLQRPRLHCGAPVLEVGLMWASVGLGHTSGPGQMLSIGFPLTALRRPGLRGGLGPG